jgi:PAS domain S-box-containing protein
MSDSLLQLFEQAPCGYICTLPDGTFTRVNQTFLELTGYTRADLERRRRFQDVLTVASRVFYENQYAPLLRMQGFVKEVAFDVVHQNGERIPVLANAVRRPDARHAPGEIACIIFEATDRRTYERELLLARRRAEQLAAVVSQSPDAILSVTADGYVQTWNPSAERLFGRSRATMAPRHVAELITAFGTSPNEWPRVLAELHAGRAVQMETQVRQDHGVPVEISVGIAAQLDELGELSAVSLIVRDIGERRALERQKDEFLATVSHDLKNPVAAIKGWAQLLIRRTAQLPDAERARWREGLATIDATTGRLAAMIGELLDLTSIGMGRPLELHLRPTDLVALTQRVAAENQQLTESHTVIVRSALDVLEGRWDRARLERVVGNLVSNAIKYSPDGGAVTLTITRESTSSCDLAVLRVADQGVGIAAHDQPRVFDRFYRAADVADTIPGSGLGLAGVKQLVELHGGSIQVQSVPGEGATFILRLPLGPDG